MNKLKGNDEIIIISKGYDWGPANYKLIVALGDIVQGDIDKDAFTVSGSKKVLNVETMQKEELTDEVAITNAYLSTETGEPVDFGKFLALELAVHPNSMLTSPFTFDIESVLNIKDQVKYTVTLNNEIKPVTLETNEKTKTIYEGIEKFSEFDFSYEDEKFGDIQLKYGLFIPEEKENKPLIVLFHGAGEGGNDVSIVLLGNKVVALAEEEIQSEFGGAYVLVPQAPTMWMDDGKGEYTKDGFSKYTNAVIEMIEQVIEENPGIDAQRVYVGGGSNGGYMTLNMILTKPELFAAAFPICAAYESEWVSDEQMNHLKDFPIWFVHSTDDPLVKFETTAKAWTDRLIASGHKNVHLSSYDGVFDRTGLYKDDKGNAHRYNGHWSWIPVYNNEVKDAENTLFAWLADQKRD